MSKGAWQMTSSGTAAVRRAVAMVILSVILLLLVRLTVNNQLYLNNTKIACIFIAHRRSVLTQSLSPSSY